MNQSSASDLTSIDCTGASAEVVLMYCGTEVERDEGSASQGCARVVPGLCCQGVTVMEVTEVTANLGIFN